MSAPKTIRMRKGKLEVELEKLRCECAWGRAMDLISPYKSDSALSYLYFLIMSESKLENFELGYLSGEDMNFAESCLRETMKSTDEGYILESSVLYGKTLYLRKKFDEALKFLLKLNLKGIKLDAFNTRLARIISEGFAVIGLSIEERAQSTRSSLSEKDKTEAQNCYKQSCELAIRHFQDLFQTGVEHPNSVSFPKVVFMAVKQFISMIQQSGNISEAVAELRHLLRFTETPSTKSVRQWVSFQLAELLLRGVCASTYEKYDPCKDKNKHPSPHQYPASRFVPSTQYEEVVLMLLISEHIANQEVILNRPTSASDTRITESFNNTSAVYDLLTIALATTGNFDFLSKTLEKSLKFSYHHFHIWFQFALSLISAEKYYRAYLVLRECLRLNSNKLSVLLLATSLCFGYLDFVDEGLELASQAVEVSSTQNDSVMSARAHLMLGWGYSLLARKSRLVKQRAELENLAIVEYKRATNLDPDDHIAWYHLGVELATQRHIEDALAACHNSLRLMPSHSNTLYLLALLHTAGRKRMDQASKVLRVGLADRPNDFTLLFLLAKVEAVRQGPKAGLLVCRRLVEAWRDVSSSSRPSTPFDRLHGHNDISRTTSDDMSSVSLTFHFGLEDECTMPMVSSATENQLVSVLSGIADRRVVQSGCSVVPIPTDSSPSPASKLQAKIYHGLAELYIENGQLQEASDALDGSVKLLGLDAQTLYLRGLIEEKQGCVLNARATFEGVIAINPAHLHAHLSLAEILCQTDQAALAERVVRDAMSIDPTCYRVWKLLAKVLTLPSATEPASDSAAAKALLNAIDLEQTEPLEPFSQLPLGMAIHC